MVTALTNIMVSRRTNTERRTSLAGGDVFGREGLNRARCPAAADAVAGHRYFGGACRRIALI
jgi:hypothetical protein